jgi:hypothetical protein
VVLPRGSIVAAVPNELRTDDRRRQAILAGMGVHPGFADLLVLTGGRILFLELKSSRGDLRAEQRRFRDDVTAQDFGWALVRSVDDAIGAVAALGVATRIARR